MSAARAASPRLRSSAGGGGGGGGGCGGSNSSNLYRLPQALPLPFREEAWGDREEINTPSWRKAVDPATTGAAAASAADPQFSSKRRALGRAAQSLKPVRTSERKRRLSAATQTRSALPRGISPTKKLRTIAKPPPLQEQHPNLASSPTAVAATAEPRSPGQVNPIDDDGSDRSPEASVLAGVPADELSDTESEAASTTAEASLDDEGFSGSESLSPSLMEAPPFSGPPSSAPMSTSAASWGPGAGVAAASVEEEEEEDEDLSDEALWARHDHCMWEMRYQNASALLQLAHQRRSRSQSGNGGSGNGDLRASRGGMCRPQFPSRPGSRRSSREDTPGSPSSSSSGASHASMSPLSLPRVAPRTPSQLGLDASQNPPSPLAVPGSAEEEGCLGVNPRTLGRDKYLLEYLKDYVPQAFPEHLRQPLCFNYNHAGDRWSQPATRIVCLGPRSIQRVQPLLSALAPGPETPAPGSASDSHLTSSYCALGAGSGTGVKKQSASAKKSAVSSNKKLETRLRRQRFLLLRLRCVRLQREVARLRGWSLRRLQAYLQQYLGHRQPPPPDAEPALAVVTRGVATASPGPVVPRDPVAVVKQELEPVLTPVAPVLPAVSAVAPAEPRQSQPQSSRSLPPLMPPPVPPHHPMVGGGYPELSMTSLASMPSPFMSSGASPGILAIQLEPIPAAAATPPFFPMVTAPIVAIASAARVTRSAVESAKPAAAAVDV